VFHYSSCHSVVVNETFVDHFLEAETVVLEDDGFHELSSFTHEHQNAYKLDMQENIFVAMALVYSGDLRLLELFPSVVKVDDTSHTNNEKWTRMAFTGQTSSGHGFTWMRVFLPNKTAGAFCWMFHILLPKLLGDSLLQWINVLISDGDSQEMSQLDNAKYHLSKVLLMHYLKAERMFNICGKNHSIPNQVIKFITAHVFHHENNYVFWH